MAKKVLIINASPRHGGNGESLCAQFEKGAVNSGHEVENVYLQGLNIAPCLACYACRKDEMVCVQKDDMTLLLDKLVNADVIVLSTPVYYYSMSGQLKVMIDRTLSRGKEIANKDFYFMATAACEKEAMERTIDAMRGFTDCLPNAKVKGVVYGEKAWQKGEILYSQSMTQAYNFGLNS